MRVKTLLHKLFDVTSLKIDKRISKTLLDAVDALIKDRRLSIFGLGRALGRASKVKHNIKCIDRLFGNKTLHKKTTVYYKKMTRILLSGKKRPIILIDWSGLSKCGEFHMLRASTPVGGRALTLLDMAYPLREYTKHSTHKEFMFMLKELLPEDCKPIIVTDAGFRGPWFTLVRSLGWDFVGRVRNSTQYKNNDSEQWLPIKSLYDTATQTARYIGEMLLAKSKPLSCHFYIMKKTKKNRVKKNLVGKKVRCSVSLKHAKRESEPWLIVTSLPATEITASQVMKIYGKRMQIEEAFRDIKNTRNGFSLRHCRSYNRERLNVALLIGAVGMFLLWIIGVATKNKKLHYGFQANTVKTKNVLSTFTIGFQALLKKLTFYKTEFLQALRDIQDCVTALDAGCGIIANPI